MGRRLDPGRPVPSGPASPHALYGRRGAGQAGGGVGVSLEAAGLLIHGALPQLLARLGWRWGGCSGRGFRQVQD